MGSVTATRASRNGWEATRAVIVIGLVSELVTVLVVWLIRAVW